MENRMNKFLVFLLIISSVVFSEEVCNFNGSNEMIPNSSCSQFGYVCHLAVDVNNAQNVMAFFLGTDQNCTTWIQTQFETTDFNGTKTNSLKVFLIESEEYNTDALAMTLAGALALSASNNKIPVRIIYHQVKEQNYGGILLQSISLVGN